MKTTDRLSRAPHGRFRGKTIVLGVTGSIAAYKAVSLARRLMAEGAAVQVVMTHHAQRFITPLTFQELTGRPVGTDLFASDAHMPHLALAEDGEGFRVLPAYPHLCLWADSVELLYGSSEVLPRFSEGWEKRRLMLGEQGTRFENRSLPLGAVYLLGERRPDPAPYVEAIRPPAALLALVADTFATKVLDRELRAREFAVLGRLVSTVPVRRVYPHREADRLEDLCKVIRQDLDSLNIQRSSRPIA